MADDERGPARAFLEDRARAYQAALPTEAPATLAVLADLAKFCRAGDSTFHPDPRVSAQLDGRREVYLRVVDHLNLSPDALWAKYGMGVKKGREE